MDKVGSDLCASAISHEPPHNGSFFFIRCFVSMDESVTRHQQILAAFDMYFFPFHRGEVCMHDEFAAANGE